MNNEELAKRMARDIFACGDDGPNQRAVRLQYRTGTLDNERSGGGFIESSFATYLERLLDEYAPKTVIPFPANYGTKEHPCRVLPPADPKPSVEGIWPPGAEPMP